MLPLKRDGSSLGNQRFHMVSDDTAFQMTAFTDGIEDYEWELHALLGHSPLRAIQWMNLGGHRIQFATISK